jgi:outer membrane lipoprotein-sorting protein
MKRVLFSSLTIAAVAAALIPSNTRAANGNVDAILEKMQNAGRNVRTLTAALRQETRSDLGGKPATSGGKLMFSHGGKTNDNLRIDYDKPEGQIVAVVGDEIYLVQKVIKQVTITSRKAQASKNQEFAFLATPYESAASLRARYDIVYGGDEQVDGAATSKLVLTPKQSTSIQNWSVWVNQNSWLPVKYQVLEANGSRSIFTLSNIQINAKLGQSFKPSWPRDYSVVRP